MATGNLCELERGWPRQLVVVGPKAQEVIRAPKWRQPLADPTVPTANTSCRFATPTTSCRGHPAAEANLIARREETAAVRSQLNSAKLLEENPTLMRLRELEILEKVACASKLQVVLGEKGLTDRIVNLL